jgi:hypothetical protein
MRDAIFYVGGSYATIAVGEHGFYVSAFFMALCIGNMMQIEIQRHLK